MDFNQVISQIKEAGGFVPYAEPLAQIESRTVFHVPNHPGDSAYYYISGTSMVRDNIEIPSEVIKAHKRSVEDGLGLYAPDSIFRLWIHEYFAGDFLSSPTLEKLLGKGFPPIDKQSYNVPHQPRLPSELTLDFMSPERRRNDTNLFTSEEIALAKKFIEYHPSMALAVLSYQASFADYFTRLNEATINSSILTQPERAIGLAAIENLSSEFRGSEEFLYKIVPAIAIQHTKRHPNNPDAELTEEDFIEGMRFGLANGMFRHTVSNAQQTVNFSCPAQSTITRISKVNHEDTEAKKENSDVGAGLFHIYRAVQANNGSAAGHARLRQAIKLVNPDAHIMI
jgi:hypothetical protein